jgi:hypothetical protein
LQSFAGSSHIAHWLVGQIAQRDLENYTMVQLRKPARSSTPTPLSFELLEDRQMLSTLGSLLATSLSLAAPVSSPIVQSSVADGENTLAPKNMAPTIFSSNTSAGAPPAIASTGRPEIMTKSVSVGVEISKGITQIQIQLVQETQKSTNDVEIGVLRANTRIGLAFEPDVVLEILIGTTAAAGRTYEAAGNLSIQGPEAKIANGPAIDAAVNGQAGIVRAPVIGVSVSARVNAVPSVNGILNAPWFNPLLPTLFGREGSQGAPLGPIADTPARRAGNSALLLDAPARVIDSVVELGQFTPQTFGLLTDGAQVDLVALDSAMQEFLDELDDLQYNVAGWLETIGPYPWLFVSLAVTATMIELFRRRARAARDKGFIAKTRSDW